MADKFGLMLQRVYGINDIVKILEVEGSGGFGTVDSLNSLNLCFRIYFQKSGFHSFYFHFTNSLCCGWTLAVDITHANEITVHKCQLHDTTSHQGFSHPTTYTSNTKNYDSRFADTLHGLLTYE